MDAKDEIGRIIRLTELTTAEMCYVVEEYIWIRKNQRVTINLTKVNNQFWILNQLNLLNQAFDSACNWFFKENFPFFSLYYFSHFTNLRLCLTLATTLL